MRLASNTSTFVPERTAKIEDHGVTCYRTQIFNPKGGKGIQVNFGANPTPYGVVLEHYHVVDQFAVFTDGDGTMPGDAIQPLAVHYTDRYTPYGPIQFGAYGLNWYTIRSHFDPGANYLKVDGSDQWKQPKRSIVSRAPTLSLADAGRWHPMISGQEDGVAAHLGTFLPDAPIEEPTGFTRTLTCYVVVGGTILVDGEELGQRSCLSTAPTESLPVLRSGSEGVTVLALAFRDGAEKIDEDAFAWASVSELAAKLKSATQGMS